jgi:flavin reductase (DIM6/NTAB) family NADH-FMN oxidoreductase RutF
MDAKIELSSADAIKTFPAFPAVLVAMGDGEKNVITIGLVHIFSFNPLILGIGVAPSRHSFKLLQKYPDFSINIPGRELVEQKYNWNVIGDKIVDIYKDALAKKR